MKHTALILAEGFEEIEALTVVDLLRRAQIDCQMLSLADTQSVTGSHGITVLADGAFSQADFTAFDGLILPGGPGTQRLAAHRKLQDLLQAFQADGKLTAAICAAPTVLAQAGLLADKRAVCFPGMEDRLTGARVERQPTVTDGSVITGRAAGAAVPFALAIVAYFQGAEEAQALAQRIVYP